MATRTAVRIVSWMHGSWGLQILLLPQFGAEIPRPFGSFESYLKFMSVSILGWMFLLTAILSGVALYYSPKWPRITLVGIIPQQFVLTYGCFGGLAIVINMWLAKGVLDPRTIIGTSYLVILSVFHGLGVMRLWTMAFLSGAR